MSKRLAVVWAVMASASLAKAGDLPMPATQDLFPKDSAELVLLGRDLFFDPILSGNKNISCATCHHPSLASGDGVSLSIGEGGVGLGETREPDHGNWPHARIPRNAPGLFNLGASEFTTLFHDGRVMQDPTAPHGIAMPDRFTLERPVPSTLAAQAILPITSHDEMAGQPGENPIADALFRDNVQGPDGAWQMLADRVSAIPSYQERFSWLRGDGDRLHITDIGTAIAAFVAYEFRATNSAFDAFLTGQNTALSNTQMRGMSLFYGKAGCADCHSGVFQTDHAFHSLGLPPIGPGKGHGASGYSDLGRSAVTGQDADQYKFRTPSLRNVTLTAPYGHNGAYADLEDMIKHHLDPHTMLAEYEISKARLTDVTFAMPDTQALDDFDEMLNISISVDIDANPINQDEIDAILDFFKALEDPVAMTGRLGAPQHVPSGLPLDQPSPTSGTDIASYAD